MWEQLDEGTQYTANRKFLTVFPVILYGGGAGRAGWLSFACVCV